MNNFEVVVSAVRQEAEAIRSYTLVPTVPSRLPQFQPGAHINVTLPTGTIRQYSLIGDPRDTSSYVVAVQREPDGRGGSAAMHDAVGVGTRLTVSGPLNHFS